LSEFQLGFQYQMLNFSYHEGRSLDPYVSNDHMRYKPIERPLKHQGNKGFLWRKVQAVFKPTIPECGLLEL